MLGSLWKAARPHQWVKNLLVFMPLPFAHRVGEAAAWGQAGLAFLVFCAVASSVYLLNDVIDREQDRHHPTKRSRPVASGALPMSAAMGAMAVLLVLGLAGGLALGTADGVPFAVWPGSYLALNLVYTFRLKRIVVVDCMCVALGFQLRVHAGAAAIAVEASSWLLLCTFFFSLFVAFCKRYEEVGRQAEVQEPTRATMQEYTGPFLNMIIGPLAALSILSYALYTVAPETVRTHGTRNLMFTVPVVVYGVFRYLFLVYRRDEGGDPARLLFRDPPLVASGLLYVVLVWLVLRP
jgi:4-hydroxybenzoate polyprenyltransferase